MARRAPHFAALNADPRVMAGCIGAKEQSQRGADLSRRRQPAQRDGGGDVEQHQVPNARTRCSRPVAPGLFIAQSTHAPEGRRSRGR